MDLGKIPMITTLKIFMNMDIFFGVVCGDGDDGITGTTSTKAKNFSKSLIQDHSPPHQAKCHYSPLRRMKLCP
jgi:hypothetical protein